MRTGRVTSEAGSEADRVTSIGGKKALCARLGWSRPALDRRLRWDKNFPVLHRGKPGDAWEFDLHAVVAHVKSSGALRSRSPRCVGRPSDVTATAISHEFERALVIGHKVAQLVVELSALLKRIDAALDLEDAAPAAAFGREGVNGDSH